MVVYAGQRDFGAELYGEAFVEWIANGGHPDDADDYARAISSGRSWPEYLAERDAVLDDPEVLP